VRAFPFVTKRKLVFSIFVLSVLLPALNWLFLFTLTLIFVFFVPLHTCRFTGVSVATNGGKRRRTAHFILVYLLLVIFLLARPE
jgi:hypothetical protein